jgi:alkanesulfonate monooxygenase SsuD/methylene tetrahydromethanopterin reductase-like flavin-dependent oxidoreductase (luciferase family)
MTDYGRPLQFGYFPTPDAGNYPELLRVARLIDDLGLDLIGIQDHPYQRRFLDAWTLLTAIATQTEHVRVFPDVANLPLRPPAVLAKAAATLDLISNGRFELGLGAGGYWEAIGAMGGPVRRPKEAVATLEEAIYVIRLMWSTQRSAQYDGHYYRLHGVHPGPAPAHAIGIWLGVMGPKMLALTGQLADGWIPSSFYVLPDKLPEMQQRIDDAATAAGRNPAAIQRLYNVGGRITDGLSTGFLEGPVSQWVDTLTKLTLEAGMDSYLFAVTDDLDTQLRRFALEVVPQVREQVARHRV